MVSTDSRERLLLAFVDLKILHRKETPRCCDHLLEERTFATDKLVYNAHSFVAHEQINTFTTLSKLVRCYLFLLLLSLFNVG